ncbi:MAG: hypothetical protein AB1696_17385 [Planctomycetota bacterium]
MKPRKIVVIGAGSSFGPDIVNELAQQAIYFGEGRLALVDLNRERLEVVAEFARRRMKAEGAGLAIETSEEWRAVIEGADFVITALSVGGIEAAKLDVLLPAKYGVYYHYGASVGPGAVFQACRHIPLPVEIAREMERCCPEAWLLNYGNPLSPICRAIVRTTRIKTIGMCPGYIAMLPGMSRLLEVPEDDIEIFAVGINHCTWVMEIRVRGKDAYPILAEKADMNDPAMDFYRTFGLFPCPGTSHVGEFYPFCKKEKEPPKGIMDGTEKTHPEMRARNLAEAWGKLAAALRGPGSPKLSEMGLLKSFKFDMAGRSAACLSGRDEAMFVVNIPNRGSVANLPEGAIVEAPACIGPTGVRGYCMGALPECVASTIRAHIAHHDLVVDAALTGDRRILLHALLTDPCVPFTIETARRFRDEMLEAQSKWLPQFSTKA